MRTAGCALDFKTVIKQATAVKTEYEKAMGKCEKFVKAIEDGNDKSWN